MSKIVRKLSIKWLWYDADADTDADSNAIKNQYLKAIYEKIKKIKKLKKTFLLEPLAKTANQNTFWEHFFFNKKNFLGTIDLELVFDFDYMIKKKWSWYSDIVNQSAIFPVDCHCRQRRTKLIFEKYFFKKFVEFLRLE